VVAFFGPFFARFRLLDVPVLTSIPAALADRLEDTRVTDETAAQLGSACTPVAPDQLTSRRLGVIQSLIEPLIHVPCEIALLVLPIERSQWGLRHAAFPLQFNRRQYVIPAGKPRGGFPRDLADGLKRLRGIKLVELIELASVLNRHESDVRFE